MDRIQRIFNNVGGGGDGSGGAPADAPMVDTSEQVYISSLALLKMLKHGTSWTRLHLMLLYKPRWMNALIDLLSGTSFRRGLV